MELSDKQLAANRANAQKSTGPKTETGKRNSSRNSDRHGILANTVLIEGESRALFKKLLTGLESEFLPTTPTEFALVENMAVAQWRMRGLWCVQAASIAHELHLQADANAHEDPPTRTMLAMRDSGDHSRHSGSMSRDEVRYDRQYHRALVGLLRFREEKNAGRQRSHQPTENKEIVP